MKKKEEEAENQIIEWQRLKIDFARFCCCTYEKGKLLFQRNNNNTIAWQRDTDNDIKKEEL